MFPLTTPEHIIFFIKQKCGVRFFLSFFFLQESVHVSRLFLTAVSVLMPGYHQNGTQSGHSNKSTALLEKLGEIKFETQEMENVNTMPGQIMSVLLLLSLHCSECLVSFTE